jgi:beta-galactosidase
MNPGVPVFSSETYPGWLRHWGEGNWRPTNLEKVTRWYMTEGKSFNIFVLHGGTNFGFTAGANNGGKGGYRADLTSYDYGSPINEQGHTTKEYGQLRKIIGEFIAKETPLPEPPAEIPSMEIKDFTPERISGFWNLFPQPKKIDSSRMWFEAWEQNQGVALYQTTLPVGSATQFTFEHLNDYGQIYLDGKLLKTVVRREGKKKSVEIPARTKPMLLEVMVEGMGHINFHISMESDRKGLFGKLKLGDEILRNWKVAPLPLTPENVIDAKPAKDVAKRSGSHFRATIMLDGQPKDTFLDMSKYGKGVVWVNGHNLGRYWNIGPQLRLYCPATWLKSGKNVIDIVDFEMKKPRPIRGCKTRNYDMKNKETRNADNVW